MKLAALCRVRFYREAQGMSQQTLARASGLSRQTIINVEGGKTIPNVLHTIQIAWALGKSVEEVFQRVNSDHLLDPRDAARGVILIRWPKVRKPAVVREWGPND
jgi:DNA-binding XRE family transcriptional regulator